mmetsp:Transcript_7184/g.22224  ORF Transcript_7184/g.22224 Transcript_7184/m.22224 type:complete len:271 (+) Transcript_7184:2-814(+)
MSATYDIISKANPAIKELIHLRIGSRRQRLRRGVALVRGRQLIQTIGEHFPFKRVFTHEPRDTWSNYNAERILRVEKDVLNFVLFGNRRGEPFRRLDDDEFVLGTVEQPQPTAEFATPPTWLLSIDGIKHPENMGLLLSTAVALKYDGVLLSPDCVDPFNYKVLEASQGVAWTLPYRYVSPGDLLALCKQHQLVPCAADADGTPVAELPVLRQDRRGFCLAVGSESQGVQPELLAACSRVALPMSQLSESLNAGVAGGILMHALACAWGR